MKREDQVAPGYADKAGMAGGMSVVRWDEPGPVREDSTRSQAAPRRGPASEVQIVLPGRGLQYPGTIVELRVVGCLIETKCRLEPGTAVEVWLRTEGMPLRVAARLVERQPRGVAFDFEPMPPRKQDQVETLRAELRDAGSPE